jgi:acyl-CoA thioesterase I
MSIRAFSVEMNGAGARWLRDLFQYCALITLSLATACGGGGSGDARVDSVSRAPDSGADERQVSADRRTLVFVGTSLTAGLGLDPEDAYPALIQKKADSAGIAIEVVNAGVSGETSAGALRRIEWLMRGPADIVVIETGANDGLRGLNVDSTRANIRAILERVRAAKPDARVALVQMEAPPNLGDRYTSSFRGMFPEVARETGATLIPFLLDGVAGVDELNQQDGIHPNEKGERIVADNIWRGIQPLLTP